MQTDADHAAAVLLVDAANVVGSVPDGWWRDRAGAAARLVARLSAVPGTVVAGVRVARVVAVLEGQARAGAAETSGPVGVVHASGSGDDVLAGLCGPGVLLVTADRALVERAFTAGAWTAGPRALLEVLAGGPAGSC